MMSTTWEEVENRLRTDDRNKVDFHASRFDVKFEGGKVVFRDQRLTPVDHALDQLCARGKVPAKYAHVVRARNPTLFDRIMNDGLAHIPGDARHLFRARRYPADAQRRPEEGTGSLRAALSGDYTIFNNSDLMEILHGIFGEGRLSDAHQIRSFNMDESGIWFKVLFNDLRIWDPSHTPKELKVGVCIGNSEIGTRLVTIKPFVYRYACTNDAVFSTDYSLSQRHIHLDKAELRRRVTYSISKAIEGGDSMLAATAVAAASKVQDPMKTIERLLKGGKYRKPMVDRVKAAFLVEPHRTKFGVVNALTAAARDLPRTDDRVALETFAGAYLMAA